MSFLATLLVGLAGAACGPGGAEGSGAKGSADLTALFEAWAPVAPSATSDLRDQALHRQRDVLDEMRGGGPALGHAALEEFKAPIARDPQVQMALLEVAAFCAPEETRPVLEELVLVYGPDLGLRTHAARLLGETVPERALEIFDGILREPRTSTTYPPREAMLEAWVTAARKRDLPMDDLLVAVAANLFQAPEVRYLAVETLATTPTRRALAALEEILVESSSDGLLRRKAAQAIRDGFSRDEACAVLERVADRESDEGFLYFLADMLEKHCFDH